MADELIDIVDEKGRPTGETIMKSHAHEHGKLHRAVHLWIHNSAGEFLIQQRAPTKTVAPNKWDATVAGHMAAGEEPETAILREAYTEVGIRLEEAQLTFIEAFQNSQQYGDLKNEEIVLVYSAQWDGNIDVLHLQENEVAAVQWVNPNKIPKGQEYDLLRNYLPHVSKKIL